MKVGFFITLVLLCISCSPINSEQTQEKLHVLIVDGQNNHTVWPKATVMLKTYLEDSGLFKVDVYRSQYVWRGETELEYLKLFNSPAQQLVEEPKADPSFAPNFDDYDLIVSNFGYRATDWPEMTQKAFEAYMNQGGGFVSVHAANNTFPTWTAYNKMTGLGGWGGRNEQHGPYVFYAPDGELVVDHSAGDAGAHGNKHEFQITKRNEHPIMEGLPDIWMHTKDECYGKLRGPAENMTILASALCPIEEKGTGQHEPILMVLTYGKGRIFHTTLGHQQESYESVGFISTFLRGSEWAATGKVTQGVPDDFPTANQSSARAYQQ